MLRLTLIFAVFRFPLEIMVNRALVGRCGLYCGACGIYRAYKDDGDYLDMVSKSWDMPKGKIRCEGCQALTPRCWGTGCERVKCLDDKGYEFCYECEKFENRSCEKYEYIASRYLERGEDVRESLRRIKLGETDQWLEEQEMRWRCLSCGHPISWYGEKCFKCGAQIRVT